MSVVKVMRVQPALSVLLMESSNHNKGNNNKWPHNRSRRVRD